MQNHGAIHGCPQIVIGGPCSEVYLLQLISGGDACFPTKAHPYHPGETH